LPTLRDVAGIASVSTATVSHVINNSRRVTPETRARVERAIAQINFTPSHVGRLLARRKNGSGPELSGVDRISPGTAAKPARLIAADQNKAGASRVRNLAESPDDETPEMSDTPSGTTRAILKIVRAAQPISRANLARRLRINRSTVTETVKPLLHLGFLSEGLPDQNIGGRLGRPPIGLSLRAQSEFLIGVNIGVRRTQVGAATTDGNTLAEESFDTPSDPIMALGHIRSTIDDISSVLPDRVLACIGVSVPGPTDATRTRILYAPHLAWRDVAVADVLRPRVRQGGHPSSRNVPVIVENDASAAATYEARRRLRDCSDGSWNNFVLVRAGTGIGVGLVLGGETYRGTGTAGGLVGEFGHMTIVAGGKLCACGNRGCWESYASAASAAVLYDGERSHLRGKVTRFTDVVARAEVGERRAQATLNRVGMYLGIGIGNVIGGLGIARVVVSGRIVAGWKFIEEPLREAVSRTIAGRLTHWHVEPGESTGAGLGGALEVAIEHHLTTLAAQATAAA
jgi:predicted NBD/HSP70 family sugar kinase